MKACTALDYRRCPRCYERWYHPEGRGDPCQCTLWFLSPIGLGKWIYQLEQQLQLNPQDVEARDKLDRIQKNYDERYGVRS
jgi:hypothetical protein